ETIWFSNFDDQRLYRQQPDEAPEPITPEPAVERGDRYADMATTPDGERLYCVRERHTESGDEPVNTLVTLPADGSGDPTVVADGHDFYSFPRVSPDGTRLAWTTWDHPAMPWDTTTLHVATIEDNGLLTDTQQVLGGDEESVFQPAWSPAGELHAISDRTGWWNLYPIEEFDEEPVALYPAEMEFGVPQWAFGLSTYTFLDDGRIVVRFGKQSTYQLGLLDRDADLEPVDLSDGRFPLTHIESDGEYVLFVAASPTQPVSIVRWRPSEDAAVLDHSLDIDIDAAYIAEPEHLTFPTSNGEEAHALYYPPQNPDVEEPADEHPPLVVVSHGGPTSETLPILSLSGAPSIPLLTSRGIAVVDVNYRGSTGYGRAYRERLKGEWGVRDTIDCVNAARYLVKKGRVDGDRLAIEGGSAEGYATLCAVTYHDTFDAGVSYFGVADVEALARETHKFESRYLDSLLGPLPDAKAIYHERSPVHHAERIQCPMLLLQGAEDAVVPPAQAKQMFAVLDENAIPRAYIEFEGEQHGFRRTETRRHAAEAELSFYGEVFDFTPADDVESMDLTSST
ncbi:MAG TPA: S9 family peptidase, partial [Halococcus sp.]|nr:S9 family peptidase [Halococcus sp.]